MFSTSHTLVISSGRLVSLTMLSSTRFCSTSCILVRVMSVSTVMEPPGPPCASSALLTTIDTARLAIAAVDERIAVVMPLQAQSAANGFRQPWCVCGPAACR
jgi:hypothetical protein